MPRVLIPGGNGQVGTFVAQHAAEYGLEAFAPGRDQLDITDPSSVAAVYGEFKPDIVINCAAYTAVDKAESEQDIARAINVIGPANLAEQCAPDIPLLHISTDYVFNGGATSPYTENILPDPINVYGETKLGGENRILKAHDKCIILRTAWVYSHTHTNFLRTMLRLAAERDALSVVDDQRGSPTHAEDIAIALLSIAQKICTGEFDETDYGIYHYTGSGETTWYGFAKAIFDEYTTRTGKIIDLSAIPSSQFPTPAPRAQYSVLDNTRVQDVFGIKPVAWEERVRSTVKQVLSQESESS